MKIVILDGYTENPGDLSWEPLKEFGEYSFYDRTSKELVLERARDADIIVSNKVILSEDVLKNLPKVKYIALLSTGYNVVDTEYCKKRGIPVSNIPTYGTDAVSQLVFAFILEHYNQVALHSKAVFEGEWSSCPDFCFMKSPLTEIAGKTIGIFGFGNIGAAVAKIANGFSMKILSTSLFIPENAPDYVTFCDLDELLKMSDIITMHCPLTKETEKIVNKDFLSKMKKTALLINTSRGPVIDEQALADALNNEVIAGAGVDVFSVEPAKPENPLLKAKNCFVTPHIAWAAHETRARLMSIFLSNIKAFCEGKPINVVNE